MLATKCEHLLASIGARGLFPPKSFGRQVHRGSARLRRSINGVFGCSTRSRNSVLRRLRRLGVERAADAMSILLSDEGVLLQLVYDEGGNYHGAWAWRLVRDENGRYSFTKGLAH